MDCHHEQKKQLWEENKLETRKGNIFHLFQRLIHSAGNFCHPPCKYMADTRLLLLGLEQLFNRRVCATV